MLIKTLPETVIGLLVVPHCNIPEVPCPTVTLFTVTTTSTVTIELFEIITSSVETGITPPTHVAVLFHNPPEGVEVITAA